MTIATLAEVMQLREFKDKAPAEQGTRATRCSSSMPERPS